MPVLAKQGSTEDLKGSASYTSQIGAVKEPKSYTKEGWVEYLSQATFYEEGWRDPDFVWFISWAMVMFVPRSMWTLLAEAGEVEEFVDPFTND